MAFGLAPASVTRTISAADFRGLVRSEVIAFAPALILRGIEAVECVEANPVAELVGMIHQRFQASGIGCGPIAGLCLSAFLYDGPAVVPPAAVIGGGFAE